MTLDIIAVSSVLGYIALINLFAAVMHAKMIIGRGEKIHILFKGPLYIGAVVGLALDVLFNIFIGTFIYVEAPREITFTARCSRHKRGVGWRKDKAKWWCLQLNKFDPGHC